MNSNIFNKNLDILKSQKLNIIGKDIDRPWGGFFVIDEEDSEIFSKLYFDGIDFDSPRFSQKISI